MLRKLFLLIILFFVFSLVLTSKTYAGQPYMQGTAKWDAVPGAAYYHILYRETGESVYTHSVVRLPSTSSSYLIQYLKPGVRYWYNVVAMNASDKELKWGGLKKLRVAWMP